MKGGKKRLQNENRRAVFDIFVDLRSRSVSTCKYLFSIDFYGISPGDSDISCRTFDTIKDDVKTEFTEISSHFNALKISGTTGTGDAFSYIRKHLLTERGHDQPTVKRPKENRRVFQLLNAGRFSEPPRFFASIMLFSALRHWPPAFAATVRSAPQ
jgi:hypothetical protein